jgi:hypothetical protein
MGSRIDFKENSIATYGTETTVTQAITSLASTVLEAPFSTAYLRGRTTNGYDEYTKLLMYFEGTDASTTFTDQTGKTVVASGNAQIDTAQKRWGTSSGLFDGTGDYLTVTNANNDLDIGTSDFTIEGWFRFNSIAATQYLIDYIQSSGSDIAPRIYFDHTVAKIKYSVDGTAFITSTTTIVTGVWYHIAFSRSGTSTKLFINGVQEGSTYSDSRNYIAVATILIGCSLGFGNGFNGWLDELRISNTARYTTTFTPSGLTLLSSDKMRVLSVGKNLFDGYLETGDINTTTGADDIGAISVRTNYNKINSSQNFIISGIASGRCWFYDTNKNFISTIGDITGNTPSNCAYVRFRFVGSVTINYSIQLELDSTATSYESFKSTSAIIPTPLYSVSDTIYDKFDALTGLHTKNVSDVVTLSGNAYYYAMYTDYSGYKRFYFGVSGIAPSSAVFVVKYNNKHLGSDSTVVDGAEVDGSGNVTLAASDTDTGWLEAWAAGTSFTDLTWGGLIKAYMNGWKLTTANVNVASCVWTGIASGTTKSGASGYSDVTTTIDAGFQPYRMYYQLATPVTTKYYSDVIEANPSGTIIVEPFVSDYGFYVGGIVPHDVATRPISSLTYVNIVNKNTGVLTPIAINTCTVAALGVSFTSTAIAANDLVDYGYATVGISSQPSLTYKTTNNLVGTVIEQGNQIAQLDEKVEQVNYRLDYQNENVKFTPEGGLAIRMINKTGGVSVKGEVVDAYSATAINGAVKKIVQNVPDPIGVIYDSGVADGSYMWVVVSGIAEAYFIGSTTLGHLARGFITGDAGYVTGQVLSEAVPTSPFADDKHFYEIGHVIEARTGAGLAKVVLHFN